jgi:hypothetical protein
MRLPLRDARIIRSSNGQSDIGVKEDEDKYMMKQSANKFRGGTRGANLFWRILLFFSLVFIWLQSRSFVDTSIILCSTETVMNDASPLTILTPTTMTRPGSSRIWVQLTFSTEFDQDLMPQTLHHYISILGVDPSDILVALHHSDRESSLVQETKERLQQDFSIRHFSTWFGDYTSNGLWEVRDRHRKAANVSDCDWVVRSDADELPAIPGNDLSQFLFESVESKGYDSVFGIFNDRVAEGGRLPNITARPSNISEQFPLSCKITEMVASASTQKVVAFRGYHRENRGGHGLLDPPQRTFEFRTGIGTEHCGYPRVLRIDHYKWTFGVAAKLEQRYKKYLAEKMHFRESKRLLRHIKKYKGNLGIKKLECHRQDLNNRFVGNASYSEGTSCQKLPVVCPT